MCYGHTDVDCFPPSFSFLFVSSTSSAKYFITYGRRDNTILYLTTARNEIRIYYAIDESCTIRRGRFVAVRYQYTRDFRANYDYRRRARSDALRDDDDEDDDCTAFAAAAAAADVRRR